MTIIYHTLSVLLSAIFTWTGDWGMTILLLTLAVRLLLLPLSLKQKSALEKQMALSKKIGAVKEKFKNQKDKIDAEVEKLVQEGSKDLLGCLLPLLQMPVLYALYRVFTRMPMETASALVPWLSSLRLPDPYFIIPTLSVAVQLLPNLLASFGVLKTVYIPKLSFSQVLISCGIGFIVLVKAPAALGVYWVVSGLMTALEQIGYSLYKGRQAANEAA